MTRCWPASSPSACSPSCLGVLIGGRVADTTAPRRLALTALVGTVAGLLGTAAASSVGVLFVTFGVLVGGSTGLGYATAVRVAGTVPSRRGLALGVVVSAYAAGTAVLAPVASALLSGGRPRVDLRRPGRRARRGPRRRGGGSFPPSDRHPIGRTTPSSRRRRPSAAVVTLWAAFGLGSAPALAAFAQAGSLVGSAGSVALAVVLLNVGNLAGRLGAGPLSDRIGRRTALHADSALLVLACVPLATGATGPLALVALLLLGLQYGALSALTPAATGDVVPAERFGSHLRTGLHRVGHRRAARPGQRRRLRRRRSASTAPTWPSSSVAALAWTCIAMHAKAVQRSPARS